MDWKIDDYYFRLEASCVLFGYVLRRRLDTLRDRGADPQDALNVFDADKTIRLIHKLWDYRKPEGKCRLPHFPVEDKNDKHGARVAFAGGDRVENAVAVLDAMLNFDRRCDPTCRTLLEEVVPFAWGVKRLLRPQVTAASLHRLVSQRFILESDVEFVESFADSTRRLRSEEMIALGRHENSQNTRVSILWEFDRWMHWASKCLDSLSGVTPMSDEKAIKEVATYAWQAWTFAEECVKKASDEQTVYDRARIDVIEGKGDQARLRSAFEICQPEGHLIWKTNDVKPLVFPACFCRAFSVYLVGSLARQDPFRERMKDLVTDRGWLKAYDSLLRYASLDPHLRPYDFDPTTVLPLDKVKFPIIPTEQIESGPVQFSEFAKPLKEVLEHACRCYLSNDISALRRT